MTFVFDGHGSPGGLFLTEGDIENITSISDIPGELYISVDEMVNSLVARYNRFPELENAELLNRDIFILASCYSVSYFRDVYSRLESLGYSSLPILISPTEYSAVAFSDFSDYGSDFFNTTLGLGIHSGVSTFGDVFNAIDSQRGIKPSLYVPTSNELRQIVEVESIDDGSSSV